MAQESEGEDNGNMVPSDGEDSNVSKPALIEILKFSHIILDNWTFIKQCYMCYLRVWCVWQKRRSARNTQRKKYVDDIMLAMSDDESSKSSPKGDLSKQLSPESTDSPVVKPNFVYIVSPLPSFLGMGQFQFFSGYGLPSSFGYYSWV